jgi:hypothetical protein
MTTGGVRSFDLVDRTSSSASNIMVMTGSGWLSIRKLQDYEDPDYAPESLRVLSVDGTQIFKVTYDTSVDVFKLLVSDLTAEELADNTVPVISNWIVASSNYTKYKLVIPDDLREVRDFAVTDPGLIPSQYKLLDVTTKVPYLITVDNGGAIIMVQPSS